MSLPLAALKSFRARRGKELRAPDHSLTTLFLKISKFFRVVRGEW